MAGRKQSVPHGTKGERLRKFAAMHPNDSVGDVIKKLRKAEGITVSYNYAHGVISRLRSQMTEQWTEPTPVAPPPTNGKLTVQQVQAVRGLLPLFENTEAITKAIDTVKKFDELFDFDAMLQLESVSN